MIRDVSNGAYPSVVNGKGRKQLEGLRLSGPGSDPVCRPSLSSPDKIAKSVGGLKGETKGSIVCVWEILETRYSLAQEVNL